MHKLLFLNYNIIKPKKISLKSLKDFLEKKKQNIIILICKRKGEKNMKKYRYYYYAKYFHFLSM